MRPIDARRYQAWIDEAFRDRAYVTVRCSELLPSQEFLAVVRAATEGRGRTISIDGERITVRGQTSSITFRPIADDDLRSSEYFAALRKDVRYVVDIDDSHRELIDDLDFVGGRLRGAGGADLMEWIEIEQPVVLPDLEPYQDRYRPPDPRNLAVGWIDTEGFPQGDVPPEVLEKLRRMLYDRDTSFDLTANALRCHAECPVCGEHFFISCEIWMRSVKGGYLVAPSSIEHTIARHQYRPPDVFLKSVMAFDLNGRFIAEEIS